MPQDSYRVFVALNRYALHKSGSNTAFLLCSSSADICTIAAILGCFNLASIEHQLLRLLLRKLRRLLEELCASDIMQPQEQLLLYTIKSVLQPL